MKRRVHPFAAAVALALGLAASAVSTTAAAQSARIYIEPAPPAYVVPGPPAYAYESREYDHVWHRCEAPRWDPNARYMPGDTVRRKGEVYVARGVSARVYNVNSPPEWTPNYWAPAHCR